MPEQPKTTLLYYVMWSELAWRMWSDFIFKWSEVGYGEVLGDKSAMYTWVTLYWRYLIVLWLSFAYILYCGCSDLYCSYFNLFLTCVCVCVCVGGCVWVCVCVCVYLKIN